MTTAKESSVTWTTSSDRAGAAASAPVGGKAQVAYDWMRERVLSGRFGPGHRLVLAPIAEELSMSVVPVREALRRLQAEGLVVFERNIGATVAMPNEAAYAEVMETLAILEGAATGLAALLVDAETIDRARAINETMRGSLTSVDTFDPEEFTALNREFHRTLFARCPNDYLIGEVETCWARLDTLRASTFGFIPGRSRASVDEHDGIIALLDAGAPPAEVELATRDHRLATVRAYLARREGSAR